MGSYIEDYTDKQIDILSRKIAKVYAQAAKEIKEKMDAFWAAHRLKAQKMWSDVQKGIITKKDYQDWLRNQVFQGKQWEHKLDEMTRVYQNADKVAREMVGDTEKKIFQEAGNWQAYHTGIEVNGAVSFDLYDEKVVQRLIRENPKLLPEWKINEPKDYQWNYDRVKNAVTQGIIQGENAYDIGKRLYRDLSASNAKKMDMFARTAARGAQNAGHVQRMHEAEDMGIKVLKRWLSCRDNRVRDTHGDLDGKEVKPGEPFTTFDGRHIYYPGDMSADPDLVYNCRCTLIDVYPDYRDLQHFEDHQTYAEWKDNHKK